jgi:nucleotide-binding universal stress UspA family protein
MAARATRTIVVGIDRSARSLDALRWAARQARMRKTGLHLVTAWEVSATLSLGWPPVPQGLDGAERARADLAVVVEDELAEFGDLDIRTTDVEGQAAAVLMALSKGADVLVVGSRGHGQLTGKLLGSVSQRCLSGASCPVAVVHAPIESTEIVVGLDGSESSLEALQWAAREAELSHAHLRVLVAWEWPAAFGLYVTPYDPAVDAYQLLEDALRALKTRHPAVRVEVEAQEGAAARVLTEASRHAGLLVVGSRGRGQAKAALLGSISRYCAALGHCPVLVHRPQRGGDVSSDAA